MTASIDTLAAKADKARAAYEAAERAAETARVEAEQQRAERLAQYDRALVEEYDDDAMLEQVRQAERDLEEAVAESTLGLAWIGLKLAQLRHSHQSQNAAAAAARIGVSTEYGAHPANRVSHEELTKAIDRAATRVVADELDGLDAARERAGDGS